MTNSIGRPYQRNLLPHGFSGPVRMLLCLLFLGILLARPARSETVTNFESDIRVQKDSSLDVVETITYDSEGAVKHGIFRDIPVSYERNGGHFSIYLSVIEVTDDSGNHVNYAESRSGGNLELKIGDPNVTFTGVKTYRIHYLVRRAIQFFDAGPELYWNATGNGWPFPIQLAESRVYPPAGVDPKSVRMAGFMGPYGSTAPCGSQAEAADNMYWARGLNPGDGLTLVAGYPAGSIDQPTAVQSLMWFLADWWPLFLLPALSGGVMYYLWYTTGRDVDGGLEAQVEWSPPKDLTPAEAGTLMDESCTMRDILSTIIDLAARGYLRIEEMETSGLLIHGKDYTFYPLAKIPGPGEPPLLKHEEQFLIGLFGGLYRDTGPVTLSELKERFYVNVPIIRGAIYRELMEKALFTANPQTTVGLYVMSGIGIAVVGVLLAAIGAKSGNVAYGCGLALAGVIVGLFAKAMPARTAKGSRELRECLGFKRFVQLVEKERIKKLITDDPTVFGRLLPYAMVMGMGAEWASKFSGLLTEPPDWYVPYGYGAGYPFEPMGFYNNMDSGLNHMGTVMTSQPAPQSSAGSGGSGFSGGGSGGGFGGGGGGSW